MFFLALLIFLLSPTKIEATEEFRINQKIDYLVDDSGKASVRQEINLTNNISQIYAKEYEFTISGSQIDNIIGGQIVESRQDFSKVLIKFNNPIVGKDKTNQFFITYTINNFAKKKGSTWEINIPFHKHNFINDLTQINIETPLSFGDLSFSSVPVGSNHYFSQSVKTSISQDRSSKKGLLIFGNHQIFDFKLTYFLKNNSNELSPQYIPIPPDTDNQKITYKEISPPPENVSIDTDGNWLAKYSLHPNQSINITVEGQVQVHPPSKAPVNIDPTNYLSTQTYWPVSDPQIISISANLNNTKEIYDYVVSTLSYSYDRLNYAKRVGAIEALNNPQQALCTEFTDLFVTIARSKGIPAREIQGFAYSNDQKIKPINQNSDILHAWPEYYDTKTKRWIAVDPTWEKTTNGIDYFSELDLNHVAFVIHGLNSQAPPPPGSYKENNLSRSVFVDFAKEKINQHPLPPKIRLDQGKIIIYNQNPVALNNFSIKIKNNNQSSSPISLPPFGYTSLEVIEENFFKSLLPSSKELIVTTSGEFDESTTLLENKIHYRNLSLAIGTSILLLCLSGIIITFRHKKT